MPPVWEIPQRVVGVARRRVRVELAGDEQDRRRTADRLVRSGHLRWQDPVTTRFCQHAHPRVAEEGAAAATLRSADVEAAAVLATRDTEMHADEKLLIECAAILRHQVGEPPSVASGSAAKHGGELRA